MRAGRSAAALPAGPLLVVWQRRHHREVQADLDEVDRRPADLAGRVDLAGTVAVYVGISGIPASRGTLSTLDDRGGSVADAQNLHGSYIADRALVGEPPMETLVTICPARKLPKLLAIAEYAATASTPVRLRRLCAPEVSP